MQVVKRRAPVAIAGVMPVVPQGTCVDAHDGPTDNELHNAAGGGQGATEALAVAPLSRVGLLPTWTAWTAADQPASDVGHPIAIDAWRAVLYDTPEPVYAGRPHGTLLVRRLIYLRSSALLTKPGPRLAH